MKRLAYELERRVGCGLLAIGLCLSLPLVANADVDSPLKPETASADMSQPATSPVNTPPTKLLQGEVRKKDAAPGAADTSALGSATSNSVSTGVREDAGQSHPTLQAETAARDAAKAAFEAAVDKVRNHIKLTADDYRALGVGCVGYESFWSVKQRNPKVELVYRGSPAEAAGVRKGDVVIHDSDSAQPTEFPTVEQWSISIYKAGTTNEITVLRHGQMMPMKFVRMNVEDIQEDSIRRSWERTIRDLGDVQDGVYKIPRP